MRRSVEEEVEALATLSATPRAVETGHRRPRAEGQSETASAGAGLRAAREGIWRPFVNNSAGTKIGTVSNVFTNRAGAVVGVQVSLNGGGSIALPAMSLSTNGTTVVGSSTSIH